MICISIAQESRRLAPADMLNASRQCDLLEVRLDCFAKAVDIGELLSIRPKPVIMSCRRACDGGAWQGDEDDRLDLLRQCIRGKAEYVEIELDVADRIPPSPSTRRVISYTSLAEEPGDLLAIYARAQAKKPDVIKLTTLARTPEEAWPLVQILSRPAVPTVAVGLGKPGVMLSVLGAKMGAPWAYAALERGMEAYPGQPTVSDLEGACHFRAINRSTRFVAVTGFGERERATVAALNAALAHCGLPARCLPMGLGSVRLFGKALEAVKLAGAVIDGEHREAVLPLAGELEPSARWTKSVDLLLQRDNHWLGCDTSVPALVAALESCLKARNPERPLAARMVLIVGTNDMARAIGRELKRRGCALIIASFDREAAHAIARELQCRHVQFEALYTTMHDTLIVCEGEKDREAAQGRKLAVHPGYLRAGMTVLHVTPGMHRSALVRAAEVRDCAVVTPYQLWLDQVALQAQRLTGKEVPRQVLADAAPWLLEEE
jgi:3-dehydroquinate dehydratase/shikimate dehydrogenase